MKDEFLQGWYMLRFHTKNHPEYLTFMHPRNTLEIQPSCTLEIHPSFALTTLFIPPECSRVLVQPQKHPSFTLHSLWSTLKIFLEGMYCMYLEHGTHILWSINWLLVTQIWNYYEDAFHRSISFLVINLYRLESKDSSHLSVGEWGHTHNSILRRRERTFVICCYWHQKRQWQ